MHIIKTFIWLKKFIVMYFFAFNLFKKIEILIPYISQYLFMCITTMFNSSEPNMRLLLLNKILNGVSLERRPQGTFGALPSGESIWRRLMWMLVHVQGVRQHCVKQVGEWTVTQLSGLSALIDLEKLKTRDIRNNGTLMSLDKSILYLINSFTSKQFRYCSIVVAFEGLQGKEYQCVFMLPMARGGNLAYGPALKQSPGGLFFLQNRPPNSDSEFQKDCSYILPRQLARVAMIRIRGIKCKSKNTIPLPIEVLAREYKKKKVEKRNLINYWCKVESARAQDRCEDNYYM